MTFLLAASSSAGIFVFLFIAFFFLIVAWRSVRIIPQSKAGVVERLGRYQRTLPAGLTIIIPFIDRVLPLIDMREQVVTFAPQPVITSDNVTVNIDSVLYFTINDAQMVTYEVAMPLAAIEQLTTTTLRNVIGGMTLEETLTSRETINSQLRAVLDEATSKWGIRINRVELKSIDPPASIQEAMEKQMRAERDKRAAILTAEGSKQSQVLTAEGEKQAAILKAEGEKQAVILAAQGEREAEILKAEGQGQAIETVFQAIHDGRPDTELLSYQYLQMLPKIAEGQSSKLWIIPSEFSQALTRLAGQASAALPSQGATSTEDPPELN